MSYHSQSRATTLKSFWQSYQTESLYIQQDLDWRKYENKFAINLIKIVILEENEAVILSSSFS